jgi:predicted porin
MTRNRVWIAVVAGFVLSSANLVYAQNVTPSTNSDAMVDVLKTLETKGVITPQEFEALKAKVTKDEQKAAEAQQAVVQQAVQQAAPQLRTVAMPAQEGAADNNVTMMANGVGFHAGRFDVSISGEINGFYVHDRPTRKFDATGCLLCQVSTDSRSSSSVRSGLLPGDLSFKISTQEHGWDVAVFFGIWPAIQNNNNVASVETGLLPGTQAGGTPGIDFRQQFATLGHPHFGTLKIGRDLGLFGQEAILSDMTLLGVGSTNGGNANPNNVTFGRIGVGYLYTDFLSQVTYSTPTSHGLQAAFGVMAPFNDPLAFTNGPAFGGIVPNALNGSSSLVSNLNGHGQPMFQGKLAYSTGKYRVKAKVWSNFVTQSQQASVAIGTLAAGDSIRTWGVDYGTSLTFHGLNLVGYGYNGWGLGTTALLFGGVGLNSAGSPEVRPSQGYYGQATYTIHKVTVGASYGQSNLSAANATDAANMPASLIRNNTSYIGQFRYAVTKWDNLVAEYDHTTSEIRTGVKGGDDGISLGTIVFF